MRAKSILLFGEVLRDLEEGYVDKVDAEKLFQTAAEAMTASLDPYTEFETKKVSEDNLIRYNGRYAGVGMCGRVGDTRAGNIRRCGAFVRFFGG